jgi:hypothetical protein
LEGEFVIVHVVGVIRYIIWIPLEGLNPLRHFSRKVALVGYFGLPMPIMKPAAKWAKSKFVGHNLEPSGWAFL